MLVTKITALLSSKPMGRVRIVFVINFARRFLEFQTQATFIETGIIRPAADFLEYSRSR